MTTKDFLEDRNHENGNYLNTCWLCKGTFTGHKRRVLCKECTPLPISYHDYYNLKPGTKVYDSNHKEYIVLKSNDTYHTYGMMVSVENGTLHHHTEFGDIWGREIGK